MEDLKRCRKCGEDKLFNDFSNDCTSKDGLRSYCRSCAAVYRKSNYEAHREEQRQYARQYRLDHLDEVTAKKHQYYLDNIDKCRAQDHQYYRNHIEQRRNRATKAYWGDPDKARERARRDYRTAPDTCRARHRRWLAQHPDKVMEYSRQYYLDHAQGCRENKREYNRARREEMCVKARAYRVAHPEAKQKYQERFPERERAMQALHRAMRKGRIRKPDRCSGCNAPTEAQDLHGHHDSYASEDALRVRWLCRTCHADWHIKAKEAGEWLPAYVENAFESAERSSA